MSQHISKLKEIEKLDIDHLADALFLNGYANCVEVIRRKQIDGEAFLKLTELQISLWRLPTIETRRLRSFIELVRRDPQQFLIKCENDKKMTSKGINKSESIQNDNLIRKSNFINTKPNTAVESNTGRQNVQKDESKAENFSTLSLKRNKLIKEKLEQVLRNDSTDIPNTSFIYKQKQPQLPPKPQPMELPSLKNEEFKESSDEMSDGYLAPTLPEVELRQTKNITKSPSIPKRLPHQNSFLQSYKQKEKQPQLPPKPHPMKLPSLENEEFQESSDEMSDGYLTPTLLEAKPQQTENITKSPSFLKKLTHSNSFLQKFRKAYENFELQSESSVRNSQEQSINPIGLKRPLPPIPREYQQDHYPHDMDVMDTNDEEMVDYTPILEDEKFSNVMQVNRKQQQDPKMRPLPEVPIRKTSLPNNPNSRRVLPEVPTNNTSLSKRFLPTQERINYMISNEDDEMEAEYTPVMEDQEAPKIKGKTSAFHSLPPKPPTTVRQINQYLSQNHDKPHLSDGDDGELGEYAAVIEDGFSNSAASVETRMKPPYNSLPRFHLPLPTSAYDGVNSSFKMKARPKLPTPDVDTEQNSSLQPNSAVVPMALPISPNMILKPICHPPKSSGTLSKLPKPPLGLPQSPLELPILPIFPIQSQDDNMDTSPGYLNKLSTEIHEDGNEQIDEVEEQFYSSIDLISERSYREIDRKGAKRLLNGLEDGAFVIRPSRKAQYVCSFTIMHKTKIFNLGVERDASGALVFGSVAPDFDQPKFYRVADIITFYSKHPLYLSDDYIILKDILPLNKR